MRIAPLRIAPFGLLAVLVLASSAMAAPPAAPKKVASPPITINRVEAQPFQLTQVATRVETPQISHSIYRGTANLVVSPCGASEPQAIAFQVELRTTTTLNACGDGFTDGTIVLFDPAGKQAVQGKLTAVNANFGELVGVVEGNLITRDGAPRRLRAVFNGTFVLDANNHYTLVDVESRGVLVNRPAPKGPYMKG